MMSRAMPLAPNWLAPILVVFGALLLAGLARHRLVEPADLTALCADAPWDGPACVLRSLTVQAFAGQRIGLAALACALPALLARWRAAALLALAIASAGLILYSTRWSAPAALLAGLALLRPVGAEVAR
jgi:hypothetical protein